MKFTISKNIIENTIEFLSTFVDNIDTFTPFRGIYIKINNSEITFIGGNSNIAAKKTLQIDEKNIKLEIPGKMLINTLLLKNLIKKFDKEITFIKNENSLEIYEKNTRYTLTLLDESKYPDLNFNLPSNNTTINSKEFSEAINNVYISTNLSNDKTHGITSNPVTKTINLKSINNKIRLTATDSYRLSSCTFKTDQNMDIDINIDNRNFKKLYSKEMPSEVNLFFENNRLGIFYKNTIIYTHTTPIKYIDVDNILKIDEKNKKIKIKIKKEELSKVINKTVFYSPEKIRRLQFFITENEIKTTFEIPEIGISEYITTEFSYKGKNLEIDIDWQYIKESISAFDSENIIIYISSNEDRVYLLDGENEDNIQILTPIRRY
ncbi:DNA polymerase III subunit beta [Mycoplasmopsis cynos]|uniref:DNA polymerase III, beta subunit n=1 Tax=Mycoplasmopsis cynos TaxID=171284 RepID=A0A449AH72_9BACT|nr:DNA polymerase III subunit beta [Mycoplasmopsis cynos]WQQ14591.1 DNA polymerase III subunit beta [Mycoplasmopsis cynos]WQQ15173.1 DNA polymerase III subunit beta [Mycoplasmopsis cynos]WQQ16201.1 DNA polymerase III subunit beta [Mycoplasmopsis cynos]WQQ17652.1 DNA polymerase III subunit beta [Mycoplasmopsis cynos]WQQ19502.1 DNA polymerase III subunit beta [Mycoplasmopsis cynos]